MVKRSIAVIALVTVFHAHAEYLFVNVTGRLREGYPVDIKDPKGKVLATIESGKAQYVSEYPSYQLEAHKESGKRKAQPFNFTPQKNENKAIVVNVRNLMNKLDVHQMSLDKAKDKYSDRVQFPK
jgi:hypothetical protein